MNVLIACEESGVVRDAFRDRGHNAWSCDLQPTDPESKYPGHHYQMDVLQLLRETPGKWDLMIAHPPCTHLAVSGARWFKDKRRDQEQALLFVHTLMLQSVPRICIENPVSIISSRIRKPDQIIQPWQFGHRETKATCLWLKNLPALTPTKIVGPPVTQEEKKDFAKIHRMPPGEDRAKLRSRTYPGIAAAIVGQWGQNPDSGF